MSNKYQGDWESLGIADAISLSLFPIERDENLLKTIGYFWSDCLNCFIFGHGPMTPTLLDVQMITGLDINSPSPSAFDATEVPYRLSSKADCNNWGSYLQEHAKTSGPVSEREHTAFLNLWLEHFIFCGSSLAPTKNYVSLAYDLAQGKKLGLGKLFLGELYRCLHSATQNLLTRKKVKAGGPWWFIQLWARLYFRGHVPKFPILSSRSFPTPSGDKIRCTGYGQALYSLPGRKQSPSEAADWFRVFFQGLADPDFFPYTDAENFENPVCFRLDMFADDPETR